MLFTKALSLVAIITLISAPAIADDTAAQSSAPPDQAETQTNQLDERIAAEKITENDPPPLPEQIVLPKPPTHRVANDPAEVPIDAAHFEKAATAIARGLSFLRQTQDQRGAWMHEVRAAPTDEPDKPSPVGAAVTALGLKALAQTGTDAESDPAVDKALAYILRARQPDGSFDQSNLANYVTSSVISGLSALDDFRLNSDIRQTLTWLQEAQWADDDGLSKRQDWYGGAGYGSHGRPDMSNTQMMLEALYDAGMSPEEPAFQRAIAFVSRAQNLEATNSADWVGNDGGFVYTPANGGESMASQYIGEGRYGETMPPGQPRSLRSYGSMTYAGFKSLLYAGLSPDDVRVRAAFDWIRKNWTFDENPGVGQQGLYYYYHAMARALNVAQQHIITDDQGVEHNWREELIDAIVKRQNEDGSWQNAEDRWLEGHPELATIYSVLALEEALKPTLRQD